MNPGGLLRRALCAAALGSLALAAPAGATLTGPGVRAGHNISVFANIDFVGVFGYSVGAPMTVELVRNGHVINRVSAETVSTPEGGGLEINHGPAGAPQPGDCWTNFARRARGRHRARHR